MRSSKPAIAFAALLASCGGSGEDPPAAGTGDGLVVDLRVAVRPEGSGGPKQVRRIKCESLGDGAIQPSCRALRGLEPQDLDPVPGGVACAQIYGGPATARVAGKLRGVRVTASFDLTDSCQVKRWRRNAALLGRPPARRLTTPPGRSSDLNGVGVPTVTGPIHRCKGGGGRVEYGAGCLALAA